MGWTERDYAKWSDEERDRFYGQGPGGGDPRSSGVVFRSGVGSAILASAVLFGLGHFPAGHPILPLPHFSLPGSHSTPAIRPAGTIRLPATATLGSTLTFHGTAPPGNAPVTVEGSYDGGQTWQTLSNVGSANGSYAAEIALNGRGTLQIRIRFADGSEAVGALVVS